METGLEDIFAKQRDDQKLMFILMSLMSPIKIKNLKDSSPPLNRREIAYHQLTHFTALFFKILPI